MYKTTQEAVNTAKEIYANMCKAVRHIYQESEEYPIFKKSTEEELLYNTECYIQQVFKNIALANDKLSEEENAFIKEMSMLSENIQTELNSDEIVESVINGIPEYLVIAKEVDKYNGNTKHARKLLLMTEEIFRILENIDSISFKSESDFINAISNKLREYLDS